MKLPLFITSFLLMTLTVFAQQKLEPYPKATAESLKVLKLKSPLKVPVAELLPKGNMSSTINVAPFQQFKLYTSSNPNQNPQLSKSIHRHYTKELQEQGYHPIFRCKDNCRSILKQILPKLLSKSTQHYKLFFNTKRYSYTISHKGSKVMLCITLHNNAKKITTLIGSTTFK